VVLRLRVLRAGRRAPRRPLHGRTRAPTGRTLRLWLDGEPAPPRAPFAVDAGSLFVAFFASAEMGCFLALGWPTPANLLELYVETKWLTCGRACEPSKPSLVYALDRFGLTHIDANEKEETRRLAIRGGP
jgi:hypothetical protein